jgi:hypothetical protein
MTSLTCHQVQVLFCLVFAISWQILAQDSHHSSWLKTRLLRSWKLSHSSNTVLRELAYVTVDFSIHPRRTLLVRCPPSMLGGIISCPEPNRSLVVLGIKSNVLVPSAVAARKLDNMLTARIFMSYTTIFRLLYLHTALSSTDGSKGFTIKTLSWLHLSHSYI